MELIDKTDFNTYRLVMAIKQQCLLSKLKLETDIDSTTAGMLQEAIESIVWDESPRLKVALVMGVPSHERREFLGAEQENRHDDHLKKLIHKYAALIDSRIANSSLPSLQ